MLRYLSFAEIQELVSSFGARSEFCLPLLLNFVLAGLNEGGKWGLPSV
jgi:hypothetical protein